jgi:hypothetical protein
MRGSVVIFEMMLMNLQVPLEQKTPILGEKLTEAKSRDSSVGIALDYGLDDRIPRVRFPVGAGNFSGTHPASYPMRTRGSFDGGKAVGA